MACFVEKGLLVSKHSAEAVEQNTFVGRNHRIVGFVDNAAWFGFGFQEG